MEPEEELSSLRIGSQWSVRSTLKLSPEPLVLIDGPTSMTTEGSAPNRLYDRGCQDA